MQSRGVGGVLVGGVVLFVLGCGPNAEERCQELEAAVCPAGQTNNEDGSEMFCVDRYDGDCAGKWDEYVSCAIEDPQCRIEQGGGYYTTQGGDACRAGPLTEYGRCLCEVEGPTSPWCIY